MVPDATVEIEQRGTGLILKMPTTSAGIFSFPDLPVGFYSVTTSHPGFQTQKMIDLEVQVGRISSMTVTLQLAQQTQIVKVQAAAATIETTESALNAVVPSRAVQDIPLDGRDFRNLLQPTPGFNALFESMNGNRGNQNNWQIDGVDNNDFWHNIEAINQGSISSIPAVLLPIDSIDELNQQSVGGADFGRNPGSMINVVVKSGTNDFHGTVYYFHRNDALAKESPFVPPGIPSKLRNHSYGFSLGGPVVKDKCFVLFQSRGRASHCRKRHHRHSPFGCLGHAGGSTLGSEWRACESNHGQPVELPLAQQHQKRCSHAVEFLRLF
jgi:Carboxypeptidase regulatory-like domain